MHIRYYLVLLPFTFVLLAITGCTTESWYEGVKRTAETQCRSEPPAESERCLERLNKKSYEEYEKERSGQK